MQLRHLFALSISITSTAVLADTVDINLRDNSAQLQYIAPMGRDNLGKSELHMGALYANKNNQFVDFGLVVKDEVGNAPGISLGVGIKALLAKVGNDVRTSNTTALSVGGQVRYVPPALPRLGLIGQVYFSPSIVTFGDADRFSEFDTRVEYELIPTAAAYVGYRRIEFGLKDFPSAVLDSGPHIGIRLTF